MGVDLAAVVVCDSPRKGQRKRSSRQKILKFLMDQVDDLSGSTCPIRTTSTWDYGVGPLRCTSFDGYSDVSFTSGGLPSRDRLLREWEVGLLHRPATYHA